MKRRDRRVTETLHLEILRLNQRPVGRWSEAELLEAGSKRAADRRLALNAGRGEPRRREKHHRVIREVVDEFGDVLIAERNQKRLEHLLDFISGGLRDDGRTAAGNSQ